MCALKSFLQTVTKPAMLLLLSAAMLSAQTGLGILRGTVTDPSNALVPNAKVLLVQTATGVQHSTQSSDAGVYYFGSVPIGPYRLMIELAGFKRWSADLALEAGQTLVLDAVMQLGAPDTVVEVTGAAPVITTEGSQVADVKDALRIHQLPLNGRTITNLFNLTAGVEAGSDGVNPRVNGMKVGATEMLLDGVSLVNRFGGGMASVQAGLDVVQEYRFETTGSSAEYSRPSTVTLVSKSGTNLLHGSLFETHRNNFGGLRARQRQDTASRPPQYIRNEYGFDAGGPLVKNKTFWYFAYEGQRQRQAKYANVQAPTEAIFGGDFRGATDPDGVPITIYDPLTTDAAGLRQPFPGSIIPTERLSRFSATLKTVSAIGAPNTNPWTDKNFSTYYRNTYDFSSWTAKLDHSFSEKDNVAGRVTHSVAPTRLYGGRFGYPRPGTTNAGGTGRQDYELYSAFARWNRVFSPTFLNEFQVSGHRAPNSSGTLADNTDWATQLGLPNPFSVKGWPTIWFDNEPFYGWNGWDADNRKDQRMTAYQIEDNVTWVKGRHTLRAGFKARKELNNVREMQQAQGAHGFYRDWTALYDPVGRQPAQFTGDGFASLLLGLPAELTNQYNRGYFYFRQMEFGPYLQETWRLSPRLTLSAGLRWDKWTVYKEKYDRLVNLDLTKVSTGLMQVITPGNTRMESIPGIPPSVLASWTNRGLTWTTASQAGFPGGLLPADNNNFAPRLGLAFRLNNKTVVRAGYGLYYWTMPLSQILQSSRQNPPLNLVFVNDLYNLNGGESNHAVRSLPAANEYVGAAQVSTDGIVTLPASAQPMMPWDVRTWSDNQAHEWTLTFERELMRETSVRLSYIGNHGSNLEQRWLWNAPEPGWNYQARTGLAYPTDDWLRRVNPNWNGTGGNSAVRHNGYSNTNSLQAEVERRFDRGLAFQAFYAFTRALTTTDAGGASSGSGSINGSGTGSTTLNPSAGQVFAVPQSFQLFGEPTLSESQLLRLGYANSAEIPAHHIRWNGLYDLPFGKGQRFGANAGRGLNLLIGGWQLSFLGEWRSGYWMGVDASKYLFGDPTLSADRRLEMNIFGKHQRLWFRGYFDPTRATGVDLATLEQLVPADPTQRVLRKLGADASNLLPQTLADGTVVPTGIGDMLNWNARNFFRGPGSWNHDMSVFKTIPIGERFKLRVTADFFNAFNHPNDLAPDVNSGLQDLSQQANDPRIVQFSMRLSW